MGTTLLRWLKWALLGWGALSLLGSAVLATLLVFQMREYEQAQQQVAAIDPAQDDRREVRWALEAVGIGEQARERIDRHHCLGDDSWARVDVHAMRLQPGAYRAIDDAQWVDGEALPTPASAAIAIVAEQMRANGQAWFPAPGALAGHHHRVFAKVGYQGAAIDGFTLVLVEADSGVAYLAEGSGLGHVRSTTRLGATCNAGA